MFFYCLREEVYRQKYSITKQHISRKKRILHFAWENWEWC